MDWKKTKVSHLRVLDSPCYVHIPQERRKKLDDKSEKAIIVGFHPIGGYGLVIPTFNRLIINREVLFDEKMSRPQLRQS